MEYSSVVFQEEEKAPTAQRTEVIEFPDNANELHDESYELGEKTVNRGINDTRSQENSKWKDSISLSVDTSELAP